MKDKLIHFNRPHLTGKETDYIRAAVESGKISGNGEFTHRCQEYFEKRYGFRKCLLTTSCTDALEMAAILTGVGPGDEVIVPSYTFVSSALAFVRQGATIVFADSRDDQPNLDESKLEALITPRTKVIVPVHYAGVACEMDVIMSVAAKHNLLVVEDAAQAIDSYYKGRPLGAIGHLACFSFHETKNIIAGEGGMLAINDERFVRRAEIIWEKGTNRAEFFRGEVNKYGWVDTGSSFLPTEIVSAFLWAQLEHLDEIQAERKRLWERYWDFMISNFKSQISESGDGVRVLQTGERSMQGDAGVRAGERSMQGGAGVRAGEGICLPTIPDYATNNAHMFYLLFPDLVSRSNFITKMKARDILTVFHYLPLHSSDFYREYAKSHPCLNPVPASLPNCDRYADTLVRLPLYYGLGPDQERVFAAIRESLA